MPPERNDLASGAGESLEVIERDLYDVLANLSYVRANFLFRAHIQDFLGVLRYLVEMPDETQLKSTAKRLCELSREILFASGDPEYQPAELKEVIQRLFDFAGGRLPGSGDPDILDYRRNILDRMQHNEWNVSTT